MKFVVSSLLLVAATLKALSPAELLALEAAYGLPQELSIAVVIGEWILGALLVSGLWQRRTIGVALVAFIVFAIFSFYRGLSGAESCGCFGAVKISPWLTFVLDVVIVAALGRAWLRLGATGSLVAQKVDGSNWRQAMVPSTCAIVGALLVAWTVSSQPNRLAAGSELLKEDGLVVLEPETWIAKPFPLAAHIRTRPQNNPPTGGQAHFAHPPHDHRGDGARPVPDLQQGEWIVLLYHHDCPKCREALPQYQRLAERLHHRRSTKQVMLVELPPYAPLPVRYTPLPVPHRDRERNVAACNHARLSDAREWFVQTPVEIRLVDGKVIASSLDLPALAAPDAIVNQWASFEH